MTRLFAKSRLPEKHTESPNRKSPFHHRHRAASLTGYGLIVGLIAITAILALRSVGTEVTALFDSVGVQMEAVSTGTGSGGSGEGGDEEEATGTLEQPVNASPPDTTIEIGETPLLQSSAFSVLEGSDTHQASQWQIIVTGGDFDTPLHDSGETGAALTSYTVPAGSLVGNYEHLWRVRHKGSGLGWSDWSVATSFHTLGFTHPCGDVTGVPPATECDDGSIFVGLIDADGPMESGNGLEDTPIFMAPFDIDSSGGVSGLDREGKIWRGAQTDSTAENCPGTEEGVLEDNTDRACYDGAWLTDALVNDGSDSHPAAEACADLTFAGAEWYLPSLQELDLIYNNIVLGDPDVSPADDETDSFGFNISGNAPEGLYWSSSEHNADDAWGMDFSNNHPESKNKMAAFNSYSIRCVRR